MFEAPLDVWNGSEVVQGIQGGSIISLTKYRAGRVGLP